MDSPVIKRAPDDLGSACSRGQFIEQALDPFEPVEYLLVGDCFLCSHEVGGDVAQ
jgi:hypothetical protein